MWKMAGEVRRGEWVYVLVQLAIQFWFDVGVGDKEKWWVALADNGVVGREAAVQEFV